MNVKRKRISPVVLIVCIAVATVIALGTVFAVLAKRRLDSYAVRYGNVGVDEGTLSYLALEYKRSYLASLRSAGVASVGDTEAFWSGDAGEGKTYRDLLIEGTKKFISDRLVAASLYDRTTSLPKEEKKQIDAWIDEVVSYKAEGSEEIYESAVAACGFDLADVKNAVTLLYKAKQTASLLYGGDGSGIADEQAFLSDFLEGYTHVSLFYVDKNDAAALGAVRSAIAGTSATEISPEQFEVLRDRYDLSDDVTVTDGFYFREGSVYTSVYRGYYPEAVDAALSMEMGEYREVETALGICFLYRYAVTAGAAFADANESFFGDFYVLAANARFAELLDTLGADVVFTEKYDADALAALPYNDFYPYYVRY